MRPIRDAWNWTVKKVGDHPGASVGAAIGVVIGLPLGPLGSGTLGAMGASIGNTLDQPKADAPKDEVKK